MPGEEERHTGSAPAPGWLRLRPFALGGTRPPPGPAAGSDGPGPCGLPGPLRGHTHLLLLRGGCLGDFRGHTAPSADKTPGREAITGWPRPPARRAASGPPRSPNARPGRLCPQKWPPPYDDTQPRRARRAAATSARRPCRALTYLSPLLPLCDAQALPSFLQRSRLALTSHPSAECFLGIVVYEWSRLSPPSPA